MFIFLFLFSFASLLPLESPLANFKWQNPPGTASCQEVPFEQLPPSLGAPPHPGTHGDRTALKLTPHCHTVGSPGFPWPTELFQARHGGGNHRPEAVRIITTLSPDLLF